MSGSGPDAGEESLQFLWGKYRVPNTVLEVPVRVSHVGRRKRYPGHTGGPFLHRPAEKQENAPSGPQRQKHE